MAGSTDKERLTALETDHVEYVWWLLTMAPKTQAERTTAAAVFRAMCINV